jgi:hypothetical protein
MGRVIPETVAVAVEDPVPSGIETAAPLYEAKVFASSWTAARVSIRGVTTPFRGSVIGFPVERRIPMIVAGEAVGYFCRSRATAPAAAGVEAEVPLKESWAPPFVATFQNAPGASSERFVVELEKQTMESGLVGESVQRIPPLSSDQLTRERVSA